MGSSLTSGAASYRNDFFSYKMEPNDPWLLTFFKVTAHSIADLFVKLGKVISLSENGLAKGARGVSALGRLFHHENQFGHAGNCKPSF